MKFIKNAGEVLLYAAAGLLFGGIFFRQIILSGFDLLQGDVSDARFNGVILEHWWQVFQGKVSWLSPSFFYPVQDVLGYSDAGFLNALPYAFLRWVGLDPFTSHQVVLLVLVASGWAGAVLFFRSVLRLGAFPSVVGTILFLFPNAMANAYGHTQLWTVCWIPYLAIALALFVKNFFGRARVRMLSGAFLAVMLPAVFYTSFYIGWFFVFFVVLLVVVICAWFAMPPRGFEQLWRFLLQARICKRLWPYGLLFMVCLIPFLRTYVPAMLTFGSRTYQEVVPMLPSWIDYVNVGSGNWMWGAAFASLFPAVDLRPMAHELVKGMPFCSFLIFLICAWGAIRKISSPSWFVCKEAFNEKGDQGREWIAGVLSVTVLLVWGLLFRVDNVSLWRAVFNLVPGCGSIRAVYRFQHVLAFPVAIVIAIFLHQRGLNFLNRKRGVYIVVPFLLGALMICEQFNTRDIACYSKRKQLEMISHSPLPPRSAKVFALWPVESYSGPFIAAHIDAMILAQHWGLHTINGYSGQFPEGWWEMLFIREPQYSAGLSRWIDHWELDNGELFLLDLVAGRWRSVKDFKSCLVEPMRSPLPPGDFDVELRACLPRRRCVGDTWLCRVYMINKGHSTLSGVGGDFRTGCQYAVGLSYRWVLLDGNGSSLPDFDNRTYLSEVISPGSRAVVEMNVAAPLCAGKYRLEVEAVQEHVAWFKDRGSPGISAEVDVLEAGSSVDLVFDRDFQHIPGAFMIDFSEPQSSAEVIGITGVSGAEPWGVWSDSEMVVVEFQEPLPKRFRVYLLSKAFGTNVGRKFKARVGENTVEFINEEVPYESVLEFANPGYSRSIEITVPCPVSPIELDVGQDDRKLGIGFVKLYVVPVN